MTNLWIETQSGDIADLSKMSYTCISNTAREQYRLILGFYGGDYIGAVIGTEAECEAARGAIRKLIETKTASFVPSVTELVAEIEKTKE